MDTPPPLDSRPPEKVFLENLKVIKGIIAQCGRRFSPQDGEDFSQTVMVRLIEGNYRILREFRGRSSLRTFLVRAVGRMLLDYQNHIWGKWHPSAEALRLGPVAVRFEKLRYRDGYTFEEACQEMISKHPEISREILEAFEAKIPPRVPRRIVGEDQLDTQSDREKPPDEQLEEQEVEGIRRQIWGILLVGLKALDPESRLLLRMSQQFSIAEIARLWEVDQKPLYRRLDKIYKELRKELKRHGVRRQEIEAILGRLRKGFLDF
jgi:RNA polymerase sigma factor for flagellar operon FliA